MDLQKTEASESGINSQQKSPNSDNIFIVQPEPEKPADKKSIWLTVILTIIGIIVLIVVFIVAIIGSASGLADDYRSHALVQIKKIDDPLKDLEPSIVLNNRNIDSAINKIYISKQAQPSLENTLFVGGWSSRYVSTEKLQTSINAHYSAMNTYTDQLGQLISFDDSVASIIQQESGLEKQTNPNDSLSLRAVGGSYQDFSGKINKLETPSQIKSLQKDLAKTYSDRADIYKKWAISVESGDKSTTGAMQAQLQSQKDKSIVLITDKNYTKLFTPAYKNIVANQKALESELSN